MLCYATDRSPGILKKVNHKKEVLIFRSTKVTGDVFKIYLGTSCFWGSFLSLFWQKFCSSVFFVFFFLVFGEKWNTLLAQEFFIELKLRSEKKKALIFRGVDFRLFYGYLRGKSVVSIWRDLGDKEFSDISRRGNY